MNAEQLHQRDGINGIHALADVYLMAAEAINELEGPLQRHPTQPQSSTGHCRREGTPHVAGTSKDSFNAIVDQRSWSLQGKSAPIAEHAQTNDEAKIR